MKKIAIVIAELIAPGGAEKVAADLAEEFYRRRYDVTVIKFARLPAELERYPVAAKVVNVDVPEQPGGRWLQLGILLKRVWRFRKLFQQEKFDYIFAFLEAANVPCVLASSKAVLSVHLDPNTMTRSEWWAFRWLYPRAKRVIAVSRQMQALLEQRAGLRNVTCIYNPIPTQAIRTKAQEPISYTGRFIVAVGRLERQKRFDRLLEAFARSQVREHCQLLVVGRGSQQEALQQQLIDLGLAGRVVLIGFDANPYKYMARAEFLVLSSDYEGYPLTLVEALALGCPVVATDCPTGPREIVQHGKNGLLVPLGDVQALADSMDALFFDTVVRAKMRDYAPQSVQANDIAAVADAWLAVA